MVQVSGMLSRFQSLATRRLGMAAALVLGVLSIAPAHAASVWEQAGSGSVAILPQPTKADGIVGASLSCAEQEWTLLLRTGADWRNQLRGDVSASSITGAAEVTIGKARFAMPAMRTNGTIALSLPYKALQPISTGTIMFVDISGEAGPAAAQFALSGSKKVLEAIEPLCSPRSMDGYELVALSESDAAVVDARRLMDDDIKAFKLATMSEPRVEAAQKTLADGKAMLFARLCGSSWYFGRSGCNTSAFVRDHAQQDWHAAYENEGSNAYLDLASTGDGWPNIVSVPLKGKPDLSVWRYEGGVYALDPGLMAAE
ncbi:hypothetical protein ACFOEZ_19005 [Tianweitania populi]|uniref:Uncharacterized protein n=1 Tax=Tianweitania populi TaxID=1607949 RepID=A0A8J3DR39_9HYPH|nr:hypothetical protein [Tianweitania populi]GHD18435.1 hypothetical protein GCM10016234_28990 [Tianweitania populi]